MRQQMHAQHQGAQQLRASSRAARLIIGVLAPGLAGMAPAFAQLPDISPGSLQQSVKGMDSIPERAHPQLEWEAPAPIAPSPAPQQGEATLTLGAVRFEGNTVFSDKVLEALVADAIGSQVGLAGLDALAGRVTAHYRRAGYAMAQAVVPAQEVEAGVVRLHVTEGRLANVRVVPQEGVRLRPGRIEAVLAAVQTGAPVHMPTLERTLLLLSDMPGVQVSSTLRAGAQPGTVDLVVEVAQESLLQGRLNVDNFGDRYTGRNRAGVVLQMDDATGLGDRFSLGLMRSDGDLRNYSLRWEAPVGASGLRAHAGYAKMDYSLGGGFDVLDITGQARRIELGLRYPWLRSRAASSWVYATLAQDRYQERWGAFGQDNPKRTRSAQIGVSGQWRDELGGAAVSAWDVSATFGKLDIQSDDQRAWDDATARRQGSYARFNLSLERLQKLDENWSLSLGLKGQLASGNLDTSAKLYLGGPNGVRAYESGVGGGDQGILANVELRRRVLDGLYAFGFYDAGKIRVDKHPWQDGRNHFDLQAYGVGAHWDLGQYGYLRAVYAWRPGNPAGWQGETDRRRVWLSASLAPQALPALLAAAVPGAKADAMRASNVQFYGTFNTSLEVASRKGATSADEPRGATAAAAPNGTDISSTTRMQSNSSLFGIRGSESLGRGVRAWYQIESSLNSATGTGSIAARNTGMGLRSTQWGTVMFGKWDSPYKTATTGFDPFGGTQVTAYYNILGSPGFGVSAGSTSAPIKTATDRSSSAADASFARRQENSIQYWSPLWGGVSVRAMAATGGERLSEFSGRPAVWAGSLNWQQGGLRLAAAYEQHDNFFGVASLFSRAASGRGIGSRIGPLTQTRSRDYAIKLGARYDIGRTRLSLIWERLVYGQSGVVPASSPTLMRYQRDAIWLGVRHREGNWTFQGSAGYADKGHCQVASLDPAEQACSTEGLQAYMLSLGARYSLSKRTDLYVQYARIFNGRSASYNFSPGGVFGAGVGSDPQAYGIGMIHRF